MALALGVAALAAAPAAAFKPGRWAGLDPDDVSAIAREAVNVYVDVGAGPADPVIIRHYWHGHESWVIKAKLTCGGGGHYPTIVLWKGTKPFKPGEHSLMCGVVAGRPIVAERLLS